MSLCIFYFDLKEELFVDMRTTIYHHCITVGIVAGEMSGDILGAGLMRALKKCTKNKVCFFGIGGPYMQLENMDVWYNIQELSIMGLLEVVIKLPKFINIIRNLTNRFLNLKIDIFVGIDFPDFNFILEKRLKFHGIRVIHYVSPSVWAWRKNRILKLKKITDDILLIFPFEKKFYDDYDIPSTFVGHTIADLMPLYPNKIFARKKLGISKNACCLALLPGSRMREIKMMLKDFLQCAKLLSNHISNLEVLLPLVHPEFLKKFTYQKELKSIKLHIFNYQMSRDIMIAADVSLLAAGTATLECMFAKCPMVVAYRMNPVTFILIKNLIKIQWISLPNLLAGYNLVNECIQNDCQPEKLMDKLLYLLRSNIFQKKNLQKKFLQLHQKIKCEADMRAAFAVLKLIEL